MMKARILLALLVACSDSASTSDGGSDASLADASTSDASIATLTVTPAAIPASANEMPNPLRGQYLWLGVPAYPAGWPDIDDYARWNWAQVEPTHGNYNWKLIDDRVAAAKTRGGRFGMRIMALCQGCGDHTYQNAQSSIPDDLAQAVNPLIAAAPGDTTKYVIPDWNSATYFTRLGELLNAIAARYHDDPHFAWVDVSSYGNWGEMHLYPFTTAGGPYDTSTQKPITDANAQKLVQLNATAFSNKLLVINSEQQAALSAAIASTSPLIGFRVDCLGSDGLAGGDVLDNVAGAPDHWKVAPFITEWCGYNLGTSGKNLFVQGEEQVRAYHVSMLSSGNFQAKPTTQAEQDAFRTANVEAGYRYRPASITIALAPDKQHVTVTSSWADDNVAPTYLAWNVVVGFHQGTTTVEAPLAIDLRKVLPGAATNDAETIALPSVLASGTYDVYVRVDDAQKVSPAMNLAIDGRDASGAYALGTLAF
jgi:hypothetical protein